MGGAELIVGHLWVTLDLSAKLTVGGGEAFLAVLVLVWESYLLHAGSLQIDIKPNNTIL